MKLLCLNICIKMDNTQGVIDLIGKGDYDIVVLQETLFAHDDNVLKKYRSKNDIESALSKKYPYVAFAPLWGAKKIVCEGKPDRDFGGFVEQGNLILSKHKILSHKNQFYYSDYNGNGGEAWDATYFKRDDHGRAIQNVVLEVEGQKVQLINLHGIWNAGQMGDARTLKQCQFILDNLEKDMPVIVAGDFNLVPKSESIQLLNKHLTNLISENKVVSTRPDEGTTVDYIFVRGINVKSFKVLKNDISDHLPLEIVW
ncbi:MAG: endonuclease/exonuclease/phosphatase family protein [Firmicutes bacterium]|nr:endonuclease/exonuclease/phosphatase family protein [Bacillota bacterium]